MLALFFGNAWIKGKSYVDKEGKTQFTDRKLQEMVRSVFSVH